MHIGQLSIYFRFQCQGSANDSHTYSDLTRHSGLGAKAVKLTKTPDADTWRFEAVCAPRRDLL
jgi:hypothetical protein